MMGANSWKTYDSWPVSGKRNRCACIFMPMAAATLLHGDGKLTTAQPAREKPDAFISDPLHPVPSSGGADTDPTVQDQTRGRVAGRRNWCTAPRF